MTNPVDLRLPWARAAALALLGVGLALAAFAVPRAEAKIPTLETGVSYVYETEPIEFARVKRAGARLVQTPLRWANVAPANRPVSWDPTDPADPNYDWGDMDLWVRRAVAAGLVPVLQVRGAPLWAQRCAPRKADTPCEPDPALLAQFAKAAASRYSGSFSGLPRVRFWQGLNEPNLSLFFMPQYRDGKAASPFLYRALINSFSAAVKSVHQDNLVLLGGLGPIAVPGYTIGPMAFARKLLCMKGRAKPRATKSDCDGGVHFDIFDVHPYTTGGPTHTGGPDDVQLGDIPKLKRLITAADRDGRIKNGYKRTPLWITEFAWDSKPPDPGGLPLKIEAQWTSEALYRTLHAGVGKFFWFTIVDYEPEPNVPFSISIQAGLYFWAPTLAAQRPKRVFYAFRFPFVAYPRRHGLFVWGRTPGSTRGRVAIQVKGKRGWRTVAKVRANKHGMFQRTLKGKRYGANRRGSVRARYQGVESVPFPMRPVRDFYQPPFG
ncbi:MAG: hypothetical protein R2725_16540 [Solirubrobacterales bacterium]